jgi:hypothetical protein
MVKVAASQLDTEPVEPASRVSARAAGHEIAAFMIEKKRDVRVGVAQFSAVLRCGGLRRRRSHCVCAGAVIGANPRSRAAAIHGAGAAGPGRRIGRIDDRHA